MKKIILLSIFLYLGIASVSAQKATLANELTDKQWSDLFSALGSEDWNKAFDLSASYLELLKNDDNAKSIANLRYMYLFSAAGKVSEGNMSFENLEKKVKVFAGKKIIFPYREITAKCNGAFNFICGSNDSKNKAFTTASNKTATTIHSFEYIDLAEGFDFEKHEGEMAAIVGTVKEIVPNPNKSMAIVMRIYITDGRIVLDDRNKKTHFNK
ncbi:MAG: hypothetical protein ACRD6X_16065 [Pyrinomonadaceae bacterium]